MTLPDPLDDDTDVEGVCRVVGVVVLALVLWVPEVFEVVDREVLVLWLEVRALLAVCPE